MTGSNLPKFSDLTRQQQAMLREFWCSHDPSDPYMQTDRTLMEGTGYRAWPTMDNLHRIDLVDRVEWESDDDGWLYQLTAKGSDVLVAALGTQQTPEEGQ